MFEGAKMAGERVRGGEERKVNKWSEGRLSVYKSKSKRKEW